MDSIAKFPVDDQVGSYTAHVQPVSILRHLTDFFAASASFLLLMQPSGLVTQGDIADEQTPKRYSECKWHDCFGLSCYECRDDQVAKHRVIHRV